MTRRAAVALAAVVVVVALAGYGARRLWLKSDDLLRPVVVMHDANAAGLVRPSLARRIGVLLHGTGASRQAPKLIALTFDDGPYPVTTPLLLQTLADLKVPATFFLIGRDAEQFPTLAAEIAARGHEIADHTLTHPNLDQLGTAAVTTEIRAGAQTLQQLAPDPAERTMFRPPHGRYTLATIDAAQAAGYDTILWTDDPGDWRSVGAETLLAHVRSRATAPEVLLLHSGRPATIAMLPALVTSYRNAGYTFVTVGELLRRVPPADLNRAAKEALPSGA
ncbi:MAG TPA: polysaccharide deacetylase family protein [Candidatus Elarobacter sp.]